MRFLVLFAATAAGAAFAFAPYRSLAGLTPEQLDIVSRNLEIRNPPPPPGPQANTSAKLVNDADHPWEPLRPTDIRGPCPGLNTLASHGWLDRSGIVTPAEIVRAIQDGFNMKNDLAVFLVYAGFLVDGNLLTNLLSIGSKTPRTGVDPPSPAIVGGLDTHGVFEGDASMTRADFFFGDNHSFNQTLFNEFVAFSNEFGAGFYNRTVATEYRFQRIVESISDNPTFSFVSPRYFTAYGEAVFPFQFFVDGRVQNGQLSIPDATGFFRDSEMPTGFFRRDGAFGMNEIGPDVTAIFSAHPVPPGNNQGVGNFVLDPTSPSFNSSGNTFCDIYTSFVNNTVRSLYPNPQGALRQALNINLGNFFSPLVQFNCTQLFPYGK